MLLTFGNGNIANGIAPLPLKKFAWNCLIQWEITKNFGGNAIGNVANQKSTTLPRPDDFGLCLLKKSGMSQDKIFLLLVDSYRKTFFPCSNTNGKYTYMFALENFYHMAGIQQDIRNKGNTNSKNPFMHIACK